MAAGGEGASPRAEGGSSAGPGFKSQGRRMAGQMLHRLSSRVNEAGKAFAQHVQQARQQGGNGGGASGAGPGLQRLHSD